MSQRVLITNDDGIDARGLHVLAGVASRAGLDVIVAAPHQERSGASASLTGLAEDGRLMMQRRELRDVPGVPAFAVEASPAFIVFAASRGAFGPPPDIVLSGVNHGPNTSHAVLHSGTVGAALTAYTRGIPAMAVSMATSKVPEHWDTAAYAAEEALRWYRRQTTPDVLNVNVPDLPLADLRGLRGATLAALGAVQAHIGEAGEGYVTVTFSEVLDEGEPGTDVAFLTAGYATLTLLRAPVASEAAPPELT